MMERMFLGLGGCKGTLLKRPQAQRLRLLMLFFYGLHVCCGENESSTDSGWVPLTRRLQIGFLEL